MAENRTKSKPARLKPWRWGRVTVMDYGVDRAAYGLPPLPLMAVVAHFPGEVRDILANGGRFEALVGPVTRRLRVGESIVLRYEVYCAHPRCRRRFGHFQWTGLEASPYLFELDPVFAERADEPGVWTLGRKISRSHTGRPRRPRVLSYQGPG